MAYTTLAVEGGLITSEVLERIAQGQEAGQRPADFGLAAQARLSDEMQAAFSDMVAYWEAFQRRRAHSRESSTTLTREFWVIPLLERLGFRLSFQRAAAQAGNDSYAISHRAGDDPDAPPVHIVALEQSLDRRAEGSRRSPHALVQEYLNRADALWGLVTNGERLRLLRDSALLARPTYLEFDLAAMIAGNHYNEFVLLYRLLHRTRFPRGSADAAECLLEKYYQQGLEEGGRVRERLREGVEAALVELGAAFLAHPDSAALRQAFAAGALDAEGYYRQLLRLIYRLLFLLVVEERRLVFPPAAEHADRQPIYTEHYSISRLRARCERYIDDDRHADLWPGLVQTFRIFREEAAAQALGLAALNGELFGAAACADLERAGCDNARLLQALRALSTFTEGRARRRVNYAALDVEELGSVYESLLEYHPQVMLDGEARFALAPGSQRKTTGSYYTPPALVRELIESALAPVMAERLAAATTPAEQERALLALKVCDPACGSGHFLLAAARRIGRELARVRSGEAEPPPDQYRAAVRDVIRSCLYAVDKNPLAVDLCKVALWLEGHNAGRPLTFLDHRIQCGDSLLGTTPALLAGGIPDAAFEAITGDDKAICAAFRKQNRQERERWQKARASQLSYLDAAGRPWERLGDLAAEMAALTDLGDDTVAGEQARGKLYAELVHSAPYEHGRLLADAWCAAFVWEKTRAKVDAGLPPLTEEVFRRLERNPYTVEARVREEVRRLAGQYQFFHWHLAFPDVFGPHPNPSPAGRGAGGEVVSTGPSGSGPHPNPSPGGRGAGGEVTGWRGGFDVVLGNPPWERIKLQEQEWFAARAPEIATAPNAAERKRRIQRLKEEDPALYAAFQADLRQAEGESHLVRAGGRFPLCGRGDVNTYSLFAETMRLLLNPTGRVGCIVPSGIATDDTTKVFFRDLMETQALVSLYDFENREAIFPGVHRSYKFCLLTLTGAARPARQGAEFVFFAHAVADLREAARRLTLSAADLALLNPNTGTCAIFRSRRDAELTKAIYRRVPVLIAEGPPERNPWGISFLRMMDMANDSGLFRTREAVVAAGGRLGDLTPVPPLPVGEGVGGHRRHAQVAATEQVTVPPLPAGEGVGGEVPPLIRGQSVDPALVARAKELRREMTPAERIMWEALRNDQRGAHFRRQQVIGRFIVDFYCDAARLVVEIDGDVHDQQADEDAERDRHLAALGLRVLRIRNERVLTELPAVLADIDAALRTSPPAPSPGGRGGHGGEVYLPLYEAKLLHQFDHRWATYAGADPRDLTAAEKADPTCTVQPRYWVPAAEVEARLRGRWDRGWLLGWRDICRSTDERTVIASLLPRVGVGHTTPLLLAARADGPYAGCLLANLSAFALDYVARQKIGGTHLTYGYLNQLPILPPDTYAQPCPWSPGATLRDWLAPRVLELVYTAWDMAPFARDCGYGGPPFRWDEARRFVLRCELDAAYCHLYGIARDDVAYIMGAFPIVKHKDEAAHGEYRTKRVILEIYDALAAAMHGGAPYRTALDPPPADPRVAHPPRTAGSRAWCV